MNILIIDDNEKNLYLARFLFEKQGHHVSEAKDAETGIDFAKKNLPDLILMDLGLPGMDGLEATVALKADAATSHIPVVACTAHSMVGDVSTALDAGCCGYISKPIDPLNFTKQVESFL